LEGDLYGNIFIGSQVRHGGAWQRILKEWRDLYTQHYLLSKNQALARWYGKTSAISMFTGAIWRANKDAMCLWEPEVLRVGEASTPGKADLWFQMPHFTCDAALRLYQVEREDPLLWRVQDCLTELGQQLCFSSGRPTAEQAFAGCFVLPALEFGEDEPLWASHGAAFDMLENLTSSVSGKDCLSAFWMPAQTAETTVGDRRMPGVALVGRVLNR
jgi:hypothetical protein